MLDKLNVKLTSKIVYEKMRKPETKRMARILNGTRFLLIDLYQMVKVYQDLTFAPVSTAKYFILGILKKRNCFVQTFENQIT